jgi:hypothetical protein
MNKQIDLLSELLQVWCKDNNLPHKSADDLLLDDTIDKTVQQKEWLRDFIELWDTTMREENNE